MLNTPTDGMQFLEEMMRKKTTRKKWQLINPITHAILGASITQTELLDKLRLRELAALEAMAKGLGTKVEWQELADMLNICEVMAMEGIGPEALPYCKEAQDALVEAARRYEATKRMGLSGPGIQALREVYEYHDLQRSSVARGLYEQMIVKTRHRLTSKAKEVLEL
jgi:hypothetical protein